MKLAKPLFSVVALASLTLSACIAPGEVEESVGEADQASLTTNSLTTNSLTTNSLTTNSLTTNSLTTNSLTTNSLTTNSLTTNALKDPASREVMKYVVGCALPSGTSVDVTVEGVDYSFDGELGLAAEWGRPGGTCGPMCQQWVSACVLSRVDYLGQPLDISVRGLHPALKTSAEETSSYTHREATYYGNIFASSMQLFACLPPGATQIPRVCGPSIDDCVADVVGECADLCVSMPDGTYAHCRDHEKVGGQFPPGTAIYQGSITVFLQP
jgi:hypothetical protein